VTVGRPAARIEDFPDASLTDRERRVVERLLGWLQAEIGDELLAVWLFGSRARGEADLAETDPDRRSDVDLMLIVAPGVDPVRLRWDLAPRLEEIADDEGDSPLWYSVQIYDRDRLRERRLIRSFFIGEVDRDKVVLLGDRLDEGAPQ
jgi:predicted nucleotidyltransferase